ncbi:MAG: hypothetical protein JWN25_525 [Verrucomicrobiales bacterium]|nr:hypothetical protein [Verrucomicrobiales bacterium]
MELYSTKVRAKTQAELRVYQTEEQLKNLREEYNAAIGNAMAAGEIRQFTNYIAKITDRKISEEAALKYSQNEVANSLQLVMKARQRKEAILNLKLKEDQKYRETVLNLEQKFIDELVTTRAARAAAA